MRPTGLRQAREKCEIRREEDHNCREKVTLRELQPPPAGTNLTYILQCRDGTLYTGWTNDLKKRLEAHNAGLGGKYTRSRTPVRLVYFEACETKTEAMSREFHIKRLTREGKLNLIRSRDLG